MKLQEEAREIYDNIELSAGLILDHPEEELYLKIEVEGREPEEFYMQKDEALAVIWILARALMVGEQAKRNGGVSSGGKVKAQKDSVAATTPPTKERTQ